MKQKILAELYLQGFIAQANTQWGSFESYVTFSYAETLIST